MTLGSTTTVDVDCVKPYATSVSPATNLVVARARTDRGAGQADDRPLGEEQPQDRPARHAERAQDADLAPAPGGRHREDVEDEEHRDEHRLPRSQGQRAAEVLDQHFHLGAALRRRVDRVTGAESGRQTLRTLVHLDGRIEKDVDAVEQPPAGEDVLGRVEIHQRDVAPERGRRPFRLDEAAHGERLVSVARLEAKRVVDRQSLARRELLGEADRVGLREEDERVVQNVLVAEVPIADRTVPQEVDAEHHQRLLGLPRRLHDRLDDRLRGGDAGDRAHRLHGGFGDAGLPRRDLELRLPGDLVHRLPQRDAKRRGGQLDRDVDADPERHARQRQERDDPVLLEVGPGDPAQKEPHG
jgi:hypothetical protein